MPASPDDLFARLSELGVETRTHHHPPVYTVEESKRLCGDLPGSHSKNLFLKDKKGNLWLIVTLEDRAIDMKDLRKRIGSQPLSFGKPDLLMEVLGIIPGAVTPFALINDPENRVNVVLDSEMMEGPQLNFHPLTNAATTTISPADLVTFVEACGHQPRIVDL
jgi:Ala-tRNA(Pro) deacylase